MGIREVAAGYRRECGMILPALSAVLLLASLASFQWGMRKFFTQPAGDNAGLKLIRISGSTFALLHLAAIAVTPRVAPWQVLGGACLYLSGMGLFWWAIRVNRDQPLSAAFSPDYPLHLVQQGPYRLVRHPLYCAYLLAWTAGIAATGRLWLIPTALAMGIVYARAAGMEENKFARSSLAAAYQRYRSRTGMFLPNPVKALRSAMSQRQTARAASAR
jgi:protein-S-isoprenylcysteine O-methyltransferase Ste14